jgi:hypothetical protein
VRVRPPRVLRSAASIALALPVAACASSALAPTIWPPPDFQCQVEEVELRGDVLQVVRRVRVDASGLVVYGTAERSVVDPQTKLALPVFERLAIYRLEPASARLFARRIHEHGVDKIETLQGERGAADASGLVLRWRAFGSNRTITARGRVSGPMAYVLSVVAAHLPPGERLALPGVDERPVVSVLRGVPEPLLDAAAALRAHEAMLPTACDEEPMLLDSYALACAIGDRAAAEALLERWAGLAAQRSRSFPDSPGLDVDALRRLLPAAAN